MSRNRWMGIGGVLLGAVGLFGCGGAAPANVNVGHNSDTLHAISYSGQSIGLQGSVAGVAFVTVQDTGALPAAGGSLTPPDVASASVNTGLLALSTGVLQASTIGAANQTDSIASVYNLASTVAGVGISATTLSAFATAACCDLTMPAVTGSSVVQGLVINGAAITVTGAPNQTVTVIIPLVGTLTVIINEQISTVVPNPSITVNALHIKLAAVTTGATLLDVIVSSAHADVVCAPN